MERMEPQVRAVRTRPWAVRHAAGLGCAATGIVGFSLAAWSHVSAGRDLGAVAEPWPALVFAVVALVLCVVALARREGAYALPVVGVGLAASAMIPGIALVLWIILFVTAGAILILSEMM